MGGLPQNGCTSPWLYFPTAVPPHKVERITEYCLSPSGNLTEPWQSLGRAQLPAKALNSNQRAVGESLPFHQGLTIMHQPTHTSAQTLSAIVPVQPSQLATQPQPPQNSSQTPNSPPAHQPLQRGQDLSDSLHQHSQLLDRLGEQSLSSWYRCRESASLTRQQAFAAVDRATTVDPEIAQLNRTIQQQLHLFDAQLQISTRTLRQEVAQKVGQYRRHVQQQSQQCRDRLGLSHADPSGPATPQLSPAQKLFQATTLR